MKTCIKCKVEKEEEQFPFQSYARQDGTKARRTECKSCKNKKREERRKRNGIPESRKVAQKNKPCLDYHGKEEVRTKSQIRSRKFRLKNNYGITQEDYQRILDEQNGCCKICAKPAEECIRGILDVDHCHTTNKIRGLLCTDCNNGLGRFKDNIEIMNRAIQYLIESK